jgi:glycine dehydrogenase subunit 1
MSFVPHSEADIRQMLSRIGVSSVRELYSDIPEELVLDRPLEIPEGISEWEAVGTLQSIYEFQTMICELTGMDVANASMYDGPSAAAEAAIMARSVTRRDRVLAAATLHPHYRKVTETYLHGQGSELVRIPAGEDGLLEMDALSRQLDDDTACVIVGYPNFYGLIEELEPVAERVHEAGALLVVSADPVALAVLRSPGRCGADVVVAEGQPFGNALSFGGPVVGLFAARQKLVRRMPGRIVGATVDTEGRRGYVLTLQTREQQIRREKATSNICTNQGLNALAATIYLSLLGRQGLREVAEASAQNAHHAFRCLESVDGVRPLYPDTAFVREFAIVTEENSRAILERGFAAGVLAGVTLSRFPSLQAPDGLLLAFTEKRTRDEIDRLVEVIAG